MVSLQVPLLAGAGPAFFGKQRAAKLAALPVLWRHRQRREYAGWNALREKIVSNCLTLALRRILLRFPYGSDSPARGLRFIESAGRQLRGNAVLAMAAAMARSFAEAGWPEHLSGRGNIENLPRWNYSATGASVRIPLAAKIPAGKEV